MIRVSSDSFGAVAADNSNSGDASNQSGVDIDARLAVSKAALSGAVDPDMVASHNVVGGRGMWALIRPLLDLLWLAIAGASRLFSAAPFVQVRGHAGTMIAGGVACGAVVMALRHQYRRRDVGFA